MNYATLKSAIQEDIKSNHNQEITGPILQGRLFDMIGSLGRGYQLIGAAVPASTPGTPDERVAYICSTAGTYTGMGNIVVAPGEVAILGWDSSWSKLASWSVGGLTLAAMWSSLTNQTADEYTDVQINAAHLADFVSTENLNDTLEQYVRNDALDALTDVLAVHDGRISDLESLVAAGGFGEGAAPDWFIVETYLDGAVSRQRLKLNPHYVGMYADGYVSAGGLSESGGGGGGGITLDAMWNSLTNSVPDDYANTPINIAHIPNITVSKVSDIESWISGKGYLTNADLSNYLPLTGGTMANTNLVTNMNADLLDGYNAADFALASSLSGYVPTSRTINSHALTSDITLTMTDIGIPAWAQASSLAFASLPAMYIGNAAVQSSSQTAQNIGGLGTIDASGLATIGGGVKLTTTKRLWFGDTYYIELDANGIHTNAGFYSDSFVSAGGLSSSSGTGGIDLDAMWGSLTNTVTDDYANTPINIAHIPNITVSKVTDIESWINGKGFLTSATAANTYLTISSAASTYQPIISDLSTIRSNASYGYTAYTSLGSYLPLAGGTVTGDLFVSDGSTARFRFVVADGKSYFQSQNYAFTASAPLYFTGLYGTQGSDLYFNFANIYATGNNYTVYHSGNLSLGNLVGGSSIGSSSQPVYYNGSALAACDLSTTYAPYNSSGYLPLTGGTVTGDLFVSDGSTAKFRFVVANGNSYFQSQNYASTASAPLVFSGLYGNQGGDLYFNFANIYATIYNYPVYHAGNSNLNTVAWSASSLSLAGSISGATAINSILYFYNSRVGINTSAPSAALDVNGSIVASELWIGNTQIINDQTYGQYIQSYNSSPLILNPLGNSVGIYTSSPAYRLDVNGSFRSTADAHFSSTVDVTGAATFYSSLQAQTTLYIGTGGAYLNYANSAIHASSGFYSDSFISAGGLSTSSDERLKTDVKGIDADRAWKVVMALRPTEFRWKETGGQSSGFIAQEVEPMLPFAVREIEGIKRLSYDNIFTYGIAALRDMKLWRETTEQRIERLQTEIDKLQKEINRLRA